MQGYVILAQLVTSHRLRSTAAPQPNRLSGDITNDGDDHLSVTASPGASLTLLSWFTGTSPKHKQLSAALLTAGGLASQWVTWLRFDCLRTDSALPWLAATLVTATHW